MCVEGSIEILSEEKSYRIKNRETLLLPASLKNITLQSDNAKVLEAYY